jgi:hypothetical protein
MSSTDFRALCAELLQPLAEYDGANPYHEHRALITHARAALAEPVGEGPSESDVAELFYRHMGEGSEVGFENAIAEALARWGRSTPQPIPVSERLPGEGDCDAEERCWWFSPPACGPHKIRPCWTLDSEVIEGDSHWLPASAIPLPHPATPGEAW